MGCAPVLSPANGPARAEVMFVGEAPGRLGAGRTGVPFSGDVAGARFERLLEEAGLQRADVFVTNAVLCLPIDALGRNRTPRSAELRACASWLEETLRVIDPAFVVAMGAVALGALALIEPHGLRVSNAGESPTGWFGRELAAVYHPAARSQVHRPWAAQVEDWRRIGTFARDVRRVDCGT
jgi:uracil-DNA glycosylase family 4